VAWQPGLDFGSVESYCARVIGEGRAVGKLAEVEEAKAVMAEALDWSVIRWLREKKRVRKIADRANDLLDRRLEETRGQWDQELLAAYRESGAGGTDGAVRTSARRLRQAGEQARRARMDAETTFDEADEQLSTALAREGCRKAIRSWELYEKAIRLSEDAAGVPDSR
jgi:hypothetical protein